MYPPAQGVHKPTGHLAQGFHKSTCPTAQGFHKSTCPPQQGFCKSTCPPAQVSKNQYVPPAQRFHKLTFTCTKFHYVLSSFTWFPITLHVFMFPAQSSNPHLPPAECSGSGSVSFGASRIRIVRGTDADSEPFIITQKSKRRNLPEVTIHISFPSQSYTMSGL
jgi:hypothetical protein